MCRVNIIWAGKSLEFEFITVDCKNKRFEMEMERYKAENADEIIWLRLNRLKSSKLCEKLIRTKLQKENRELSEQVIVDKSVGLSAAIQSAIGYWDGTAGSSNAIVVTYYRCGDYG